MNEILSVKEIKNHIFTANNELQNSEDTSPRQLLPSKDGKKDYAVTVFEGYGKRQGLFNNIEGLLYRIWNTVKAVFGKSDWQQARNEVIKKIEASYVVHPIDFSSIDEKNVKKVYRWIDQFIKKVANSYLDDLVACSKIEVENFDDISKDYNIFFNEKYTEEKIENFIGKAPSFVTKELGDEIKKIITDYINTNKII